MTKHSVQIESGNDDPRFDAGFREGFAKAVTVIGQIQHGYIDGLDFSMFPPANQQEIKDFLRRIVAIGESAELRHQEPTQ